MNKIEHHDRYVPVRDISDIIRDFKILAMDRIELLVQRISYVVLQAAFMTPKKNNTLDIGFNDNLRFYITCSEPNNDTLDLNPHWKQYNVNGEWVGNIHGMEQHISSLCWKEIESQIQEILSIGGE